MHTTPPLLPVLERAKRAYTLWSDYHQALPKTRRYTLGGKIDGLFIDVIESMAAASFLPRGDKLSQVRLAIRKLDTLKLLLLVLWESRSLDTKKYGALSELLQEMGRMLGGWHGQLVKHGENGP